MEDNASRVVQQPDVAIMQQSLEREVWPLQRAVAFLTILGVGIILYFVMRRRAMCVRIDAIANAVMEGVQGWIRKKTRQGDLLPVVKRRGSDAIDDELPQLVQGSRRRKSKLEMVAMSPMRSRIHLMGDKDKEPFLLDHQMANFIGKALPRRLQIRDWRRVFSTGIDGYDARRLIDAARNRGPSLLIFRTRAGEFLGGFASEEWRVGRDFFGTGESFVFSISAKQICRWSGNGSAFLFADYSNGLGFGGGGGFALHIDDKLEYATAGLSKTYTPPLEQRKHQIVNLELWAFAQPY